MDLHSNIYVMSFVQCKTCIFRSKIMMDAIKITSYVSSTFIYKSLKAAVLQMLKKKLIKILKLTVNTGQVMFSGEIYYY